VRLAAVSVDLDEIHHYFEIHGLPQTGRAATLVYDVAIDRLRGLADAGRFPLTLFAIGSDLERQASGDRLRAAAADGHEIANHSLDHRYDLVRLGRAEIERQIEGGARAVEKACGVRPTGFRAPGYTVTDEVFEVLSDLRVTYDASVFPCPAYWMAKTAAIGLITLRGRKSRSIIGPPSVLRAPTSPYRVGAPYWKRGHGVLEIPVQVTRGARLPFIGTSVTLAGPTRARWLAKMCVGEPLVNLELHGIDVLDASDGLEALRPHQVDVRVPHAHKTEAILAAIEALRREGYTFVTMKEAAAAFGAPS
jgi:peptidoglycan/xylan/chitin deacetylase (PgdA/CDA1 family)